MPLVVEETQMKWVNLEGWKELITSSQITVIRSFFSVLVLLWVFFQVCNLT